MTNNVVWHQHHVDKSVRAERNGQKPFMLWFTGLSGSGKSTVAGALEQTLFESGRQVYLLDGDNVRHGLNRDLGFSDADRVENIRRIGEVGKLLVDAGVIALSAFISPFARDRMMVRRLLEPGEFIEVFVDAPLSVCEDRDPKGLYKKARAGQIPEFTGIDSPYEAPESPEILLQTEGRELQDCVNEILSWLRERNYLPAEQ